MAILIAPYTGVKVWVADAQAERYAEHGYSYAGGKPPVAPVEAVAEVPCEPEADEAEPDPSWTVAELSAYAKRHGVALPRGARKSDMLAALAAV